MKMHSLGVHYPGSCKKCNGQSLYADMPKAPHCYGLRCSICGFHNGWLKAVEANALDQNVRSETPRIKPVEDILFKQWLRLEQNRDWEMANAAQEQAVEAAQ